MDLATILSSVAASGVAGAVVSALYQSRFNHRAELLAAYSDLFAGFHRMRLTLQRSAEAWVAKVGTIDHGKQSEIFLECQAAIWRVQLVEEDQTLINEALTLFGEMFGDQFPRDLVSYRTTTNFLVERIDRLVARVAVVHKLPSANRMREQLKRPQPVPVQPPDTKPE